MSVLWWHQVPRAAKYASTRRTELLARARAALGTDGVLLLKRCMCPEHDPFHRLIHVLLREKMTAAISDGPNCDQLVHYHPGRFDLSIDHRELESAVWGAGGSTGAAAPWMNLVGATMGRGALATVSGVFLAKSGASAEPFHIDTAHCSAQHEAAHSLQVLVALCDMPLEAGLVQVAVGSHTMTNHVQKPWLPIDKMLFKRRDVTQPRRPAPDHESMCAEVSPAILRDAEIAFQQGRLVQQASESKRGQPPDTTTAIRSPTLFAEPMQAGDALVIDARSLRRGLPNNSNRDIYFGYFEYTCTTAS